MPDFKPVPAPGEAPVLSENALAVLRARYLIKEELWTTLRNVNYLTTVFAILRSMYVLYLL
jgi:hypothetical protein